MSGTTSTDPLGPGPAGASAANFASASRRPPTVVSVLMIVLGALVLVGSMVATGISRVTTGPVRTEQRSMAVDGVTSLSVDVSAGSLTVEFGDVERADLAVTGAGGIDAWRFERSGNTLDLASQSRSFVGVSIFNFTPERAVLTLPRSLEDTGLAATMSLEAGSLNVSGAYNSLALSVSAGNANLNLNNVHTAKYQLSAGAINSRMTGAAPDAVSIDVSAGDLRLRLPDAAYDLSREVDAGSLNSSLREDSSSGHRIDAQVSAGSVKLSN